MSIELVVTPTYDSHNSDPPKVSFTESQSGGVYIQLDNRSFTIAKKDWDQINLIFPSTGE